MNRPAPPPRQTGPLLAVDTDNTGERARAGFADLHFVARGAQCRFPPEDH